MRKLILAVAAIAAFSVTAAPAMAQSKGKTSGRKAQERGTREIPRCARPLGTIAMVPPENQWWREMNLGSPEAILKVFVQQSGCFTLVNRGRAMNSRAMERALAEQGELQRGSNMGGGQVRAADYLLEPDIVSGNRNAGGVNVGGIVGGLIGGRAGALVGGINVKKKEANVTLSMVDTRTTEEYVTEGYYKKTDIGWGAGGGAGWWGGFGAAGAASYQNTEIGQVIVLAYLDAYIKLVQQLGGLPPGEY
ncbi:CsgG/HfaB family protein [Sphingomonas sp. AOB5]|uniref:CsgG/HfaB family protein n=1 Tax=Sphingomonas sp. AOB5 TaxID=3034017 RepID=UPI0023F8FFE6|nr:CsgG/HfaB family protein [Sphingomonas sp. AOB5]MDF7776959.1 CsgG/HfaB family protein [Sphingomonas sp. AOB5]